LAGWPALLTPLTNYRPELLAVLVTRPTVVQFFCSGGHSHNQYSFCLPTDRWLRLSRPGCLVQCPGGLPVLKWWHIYAPTGSGIE